MSPEVVNGVFAIVGALIGALVGVAGTWFVTRRFQQRTQITVIVSPLARLLEIGDQVKSDVEIRYKSQLVHSLSMGEVALQNTGTVPVENISITVSRQGDSAIFDFIVASANFSYDDDSIQIKGDAQCRVAQIKYLNRNERVVFSYRLAGDRKTPEVVVRKLGVEVISKKDFVGWIPDIYAEIVFSLFSAFPGFNIIGRCVKPYRLYLESRKNIKPKRDFDGVG